MNCPYPKWVAPAGASILVPCGKCLACLTTKRNDWSFRLMQEWRASTGALFVTLTYHPKFVPDTGVNKRHVQLFMKRLRKVAPKIRYYAVGEYGTKTKRPHYHLILFGVLDQSWVRRSWKIKGQEIGIVHIGRVSEASIRYTTKYVIQRVESSPEGMSPPFSLMSRAYGLGGMYLSDAMIEWHRNNLFNYAQFYEQKVRLPRYYKEKIWYRVPKKERRYMNDDFIEHKDRKEVSRISRELIEQQDADNRKLLVEAGYDPDLIMAEMRNAVLSRVKEKVSFSQTF